MAGFLISIAIAAGTMLIMWALAWGGHDERQSDEAKATGELSPAERRHLYRQLRINPNSLTRQDPPHLAWLHSKRTGRRRTDA